MIISGYSGSDINALAREASLGPIRSLGDKLMSVDEKNIRPISLQDFVLASQTIRPSVSGSLIDYFQKWNSQYGVSG